LSVEKAELYGITFGKVPRFLRMATPELISSARFHLQSEFSREKCLDETMMTDPTTDPTDETAQLSLRLKEWFRYVMDKVQLFCFVLPILKYVI
jgi:hypothetical protein